MEPASAIAISLALGAEMIARSETIAPTTKDAYVTLRELIRTVIPARQLPILNRTHDRRVIDL